jgi:hypothetical protein
LACAKPSRRRRAATAVRGGLALRDALQRQKRCDAPQREVGRDSADEVIE